MNKQILYKVYRIYRGKKELIGSYSDPLDAHEAAKRYDLPQAYVQIVKVASEVKENI